MRPRPVRVERQINRTAMILGSAPSVESLRCEGPSPDKTTGHHDLCDDNGWDHPGPCVLETELDEHGGWCGTPCERPGHDRWWSWSSDSFGDPARSDP